MRKTNFGLAIATALAMAASETSESHAGDATQIAPAYRLADNKPGKGAKSIPPGQIVRQRNGPKPIPPGQLKKWRRGSPLPDSDWIYIDDLYRWKLQPLGPGQSYVRIDNDVLRVWRDTLIVIEAVGIVDNLLR